MPIRLEASSSLTQDVLRHCISPSISHAVILAGVARVFTSINPVGVAITGAVAPICDYVLDKILPTLNCSDNATTNLVRRYHFTRVTGYALGTLAATAMGFPITLQQAVLLSTCSNLVLAGVALVVLRVAAKFFAEGGNVENFMHEYCEMIIDSGHTFSGFGIYLLSHAIDDMFSHPNTSSSETSNGSG